MDLSKDAKTDSQISSSPEAAQDENERRLFHLKTLYDVSRELLGVVETKTILKNFLLRSTHLETVSLNIVESTYSGVDTS